MTNKCFEPRFTASCLEQESEEIDEEDLETKKLEKEFNDCVKVFNATIKVAQEKIDQFLQLADVQIKNAILVAEEYGVPVGFDLEILPHERTYLPESFNKKFPVLAQKRDDDFEDQRQESLYDLLSKLGIHSHMIDDPGFEYWEISNFC